MASRISFIYLTITNTLAAIPDTYAQVLIGYYGDQLVSKYGRRKPLVCLGLVLKMIAILALAFPPSKDMLGLFLWLFPWTIVNNCAGIIYSVPLSSWLIESSHDNADYIQIVTTSINMSGVVGN